jgi:hypothetical protein
MNLIERLEKMAGFACYYQSDAEKEESREAIETVRAMQKELDGMCDMWESVCGSHGWDPEHMSQYRTAKTFRRAEGNAG